MFVLKKERAYLWAIRKKLQDLSFALLSKVFILESSIFSCPIKIIKSNSKSKSSDLELFKAKHLSVQYLNEDRRQRTSE